MYVIILIFHNLVRLLIGLSFMFLSLVGSTLLVAIFIIFLEFFLFLLKFFGLAISANFSVHPKVQEIFLFFD